MDSYLVGIVIGLSIAGLVEPLMGTIDILKDKWSHRKWEKARSEQ